MIDDCCPSDEGTETEAGFICPGCGEQARCVSHETLYHLLEPRAARTVAPDETYGVCRTRTCGVLYFASDHPRTWETDEARITVGFKQPEDASPRPVCYCFGYTEENIAREIDGTGESTVVEWITERVRAGDCACEYKNPTGRCCLGDVREAVASR